MKKLLIFALLLLSNFAFSQGKMKIALLKYRGGGDWYAVVDALQNIVKYSNKELGTSIDPDYATIEIGSAEIFNYPFLFLTGHGNIVLNDDEASNLRNYCLAGGFVFVDDDYGMDAYVKLALKKVFPENAMQELPFEHPVFHQKYNFTKGIPKVHEHDGKAPKTYGVFDKNRLCLIYATESNISDGWESPEVHKDSDDVRQQSLRMGANILQFAFQQ